MIYRCILPNWACGPGIKKVFEGEYTSEELYDLNRQNYNIYYLPNYPSSPPTGGVPVSAVHIDVFEWVFVDMDLKDGVYEDKDYFIESLLKESLLPTRIVDSGNGIHAYWRISDLDAMTFLRLQRRLMRKFITDPAICKIYQLLRLPGFYNTKNKNDKKLCTQIFGTENVYTSEQLDVWLPVITREDEDYCVHHYEQCYSIKSDIVVQDKLPAKFGELLRNNAEVKQIFSGEVEDRSKADYRLGHVLKANGFSREEALSVLVNLPKASSRSPIHRLNYATGIADKVGFIEGPPENLDLNLSESVASILSRASSEDDLKGKRFPCHPLVDDTAHGFRIGQVIGLVAGSGVGKTSIALNMFKWFVERNPDFEHIFIPLEQPAAEIADRWKTMTNGNTLLHEKVHVISNYDQNGIYRHLSLQEIEDYILKFQKVTGKKVGCVVIDHIGVLRKGSSKAGENQDLIDICKQMKSFAQRTSTLLIMQSQAPREKAGIGDLELNKDGAYGTVFFESYCDYLISLWQPLKRCYSETDCPTVTAYKFCKIRHKKQHLDVIKEDVRYLMKYNSDTELMTAITEIDKELFDIFNVKATNLRKQDRKTDLLIYTTADFRNGGQLNGTKTNND